MRILVLGATGLLGSTLLIQLKKNNFDVVSHSASSNSDIVFDINDAEKVGFFLKKIKPDIIINLIAITDVDFCEINKSKAYLINTKSVKTIVDKCKYLTNTYLIHISTDHLYNSKGLSKEENINLVNYYAETKFLAEKHASQMNHICLRTNFFGKSLSSKKVSFTDWIFKNLYTKKKITLFDDVIFNPLSMSSLSLLIINIIKNRAQGVFNVGSKNVLSKAKFGLMLAKYLNFSTKHVVIDSVDNSNLKTIRPKNMSMDCTYFEKTFNVKLPTLEHELMKVKDEYITKKYKN